MVSMNVAGCQPSQATVQQQQQAAPPAPWTREQSIHVLESLILEQDPDIIMLQECPPELLKNPNSGHAAGGDDIPAVFLAGREEQFHHHDGYNLLGTTYSHADQVALWVRSTLVAERVPLERDMPAVMGLVTLPSAQQLLVASVHLAPFLEGSMERKMQVSSLLETAQSMGHGTTTGSTISSSSIGEASGLPLIVAGDMNMRDEEDTYMENELGLQDIWKVTGSDPKTRWTWDTMDHRLKGKDGSSSSLSGSFNQYYGANTRQYQRRYDRIYVHGDIPIFSSTAAKMPPVLGNATSFDLIANQPLTEANNRQFLSDHFGIVSHIPFV